MPTNLPPEYFEVEKRYRAATSPEEKAKLLEELLSTIPKHKGTDKLRGDLRRKLSKLKAASQVRTKISRHASTFHIPREGAGTAVLVGPANVGKSALVAALTNATPEVAEYPFSTRKPTPGMMPIENIQVQLIDTPPLNREFVEPELVDLIRRSDLVLLVVDLQASPFEQLEETAAFLEGHRIVATRWRDRYPDGQRMTFLPFLVLVNKVDHEALDEDFQVFCQLLEEDWPMVPVSAKNRRNFDRLKQTVFETLGIVRIYSKAPGKEPDLNAPFVMKVGGTVEEFAGKIHKDFIKNLKAARVWGSAEHDGQLVGRDHVLHDGDVVELRV